MRKTLLVSLLFSLLAGVSSAASAAEPAKVAEAAKPVEIQPAKPAATQVADSVKVGLNTADAATLERDLLGVGAIKAKSIIDYRQSHGPFASVEELLEVKGIGTAILEKNRSRLSLD